MGADRERYVLDSFALLAYLQGEAGMTRVKEIIRAAEQDACRVHLSWITLGEVIYITEREHDLWRAREVLSRIQALPIQMLEVTPKVVMDAAHIKATHRLAYADAFAVVAAQQLKAVMLTGDPEFESVEQLVRVEWLPK
jgi:ribonuclease VapC